MRHNPVDTSHTTSEQIKPTPGSLTRINKDFLFARCYLSIDFPGFLYSEYARQLTENIEDLHVTSFQDFKYYRIHVLRGRGTDTDVICCIQRSGIIAFTKLHEQTSSYGVVRCGV
jgi:hypothetical protein